MGRKKTTFAGLPPRVTAQRSGDKLLYYYQENGKKIPLGTSFAHAELRAKQRGRCIEEVEDVASLGKLTVDEILACAVPAKTLCGIYFLIQRGQIAYVGQSTDVWMRIQQHMKTRRFESFAWFACKAEALLELEAHCIKKFKPWQNIDQPSYERVLKRASASLDSL